jgi:phosphomannomutase
MSKGKIMKVIEKLIIKVNEIRAEVNRLTLKQTQSECNHEFEKFVIYDHVMHSRGSGTESKIVITSECMMCKKIKKEILKDEKALEAFATLTFVS